MSLLNPNWLKIDQHTTALIASGWSDIVADNIDNEIRVICGNRGVEIAVDGSGFMTSGYLRSIFTDYALFGVLIGNWGMNDSDTPVYRDKANYYWRQYEIKVKGLSPMAV